MRKKYFSIRILHCIWIGCLSIYFTQQLAAQKLDMVLLDRFANSPRREMIKLFYQLNQENPAWIGHAVRQKELLSLIEQAYLFGLNEADYQVVFLHHYFTTGSLPTREDSIEADIRFTDAALHLFSDIKGGSVPPTLRYQGLTYTPDLTSIAQGLKKHLETGQLKRFFHSLQPRSKEYEVALQKLNGLQRMQNQKDIGETSVRSTLADSTNRPLLVRLYQLGITDRGDTVASKKKIKEYITAAQDEFDLVKDGKLGPVTLRALNTTLKRRIDALKALLHTLRWLEDLKQTGSVLLLNIPSANLLVYEKGNIVLDSKVIVGKPSTPTPTLSSTITEVILYPYWNVTHNIATKEMLPRIKRDIGYLERGNYQVLNMNGKVLNPYSINWHALNRRYFPYRIRQSTGCDNALGIVKFNFYNPFTVYLHDTPTKTLFASTRRFFSHGCMRVEKPVELARFLLGFNRIAIDTLTAKGCLTSEAPKPVRVENPLPVLILYQAAWYSRDGKIRFYEDIYNRLTTETQKTVLQRPGHNTGALTNKKDLFTQH